MKSGRSVFTSATWMKKLVIVLIGLAVADTVLTDVLVSSGWGEEANPLMRALVGGPAFLILKIGASLGCGWLLLRAFKDRPRLVSAGTLGVTVVYSGIVTWNLSVLLATVA